MKFSESSNAGNSIATTVTLFHFIENMGTNSKWFSCSQVSFGFVAIGRKCLNLLRGSFSDSLSLHLELAIGVIAVGQVSIGIIAIGINVENI